jgi:hypothetical protein
MSVVERPTSICRAASARRSMMPTRARSISTTTRRVTSSGSPGPGRAEVGSARSGFTQARPLNCSWFVPMSSALQRTTRAGSPAVQGFDERPGRERRKLRAVETGRKTPGRRSKTP